MKKQIINHMNIVYLIIFLIFTFFVFFGAHYLLYLVIIKFFLIQSVLLKKIFFLSILALSLFYIFSILFLHWSDFVLPRLIYFAANVWAGLLVNLLLACVLLGAIMLLVKMFNFELSVNSRLIIGIIVFATAGLFTIYGYIVAMNPKIKNISVTIPNLPEEWKGGKIVQISDTHLGAINSDAFMDKIISKVNAVQPDIVVVTGDYFDSLDGDVDHYSGLLAKLEVKKGIYFVTGNHETYLDTEKIVQSLAKYDINVLDDQVVDVSGLKIVGVSYPEQNTSKNVVNVLESLKSDYDNKPTVLLYHSPVQIGGIKKQGINLQFSGHTHQGQLFPFGYITKLIFKGYDYGLYQDDDYVLYTTNGSGTWGPPMRTGNIPEIPVITLK